MTKFDTFENVRNWIEEIHRHTPADLPIILIGNKSDLDQRRKVDREQAVDFARELGISYMETSALNKSNVEKAFMTLVGNIYQKKKQTTTHQDRLDEPKLRGIGPSIPVVSNPLDEENVGQQSFHLKNDYSDDESTDPQKQTRRCC